MDSFITLDYGSGGGKTASLIEQKILPALGNPVLNQLTDGAVVEGFEQLVFSTDSFVVNPCFFPGGDIGKLAVCGTVNDICVSGGKPAYLSLGLILEEGFPAEKLERILDSIRLTAEETGTEVVTGDTKVVEKGKGDGIYINTSGIGRLACPGLSPEAIRPGDRILVSGPVGEHGIAVMLSRYGDLLQGDVRSDCAPLHRLCGALYPLGGALRVMRDPTRGGLATTLCEFMDDSGYDAVLEEKAIPVTPSVRAACELLGLDPLYAACEGRLLAVVAPEKTEEALSRMRAQPEGEQAAVIGEIGTAHPGKVIMRTSVGGSRVITRLSGAQLPRIC